jgi:hypothetical protein
MDKWVWETHIQCQKEIARRKVVEGHLFLILQSGFLGDLRAELLQGKDEPSIHELKIMPFALKQFGDCNCHGDVGNFFLLKRIDCIKIP